MNIDYPGLLKEPLPSGQVRYRVRPEGQPRKRITIHASPGDEDFQRQYLAARRGGTAKTVKPASTYAKPRSIGWLVNTYFEYLEARVSAATTSAKTLKKKRNLLARLLKRPDRVMLIPQEKLIEMQDGMAATPAQADAFIEAVAVMYDWAVKRKHVSHNPARGIDRVYVKGHGATPWKADDVRAFFQRHKAGSKPHVAMSLLLWTGCRVEDLTTLGRRHECVIEGVEAIRWTPGKKGSSEVAIPLLPPLKTATRAPIVQGATYVLGRGGKPYASGDSMSAMVKRWCADAGLGHLSAHGVRKGLAELLAELGCSQYEIMAILGHSEARTSEVYTRRVERWKLALGAMDRVTVSGAWI
ncbi:tyrosine-type recombinase/integrase [Hoeflea sp. YIM 152468]|uniref:tyrosine-type recombinase/integrase n=1 Tax=Hoeflea sp. YIM 152468 TaxID=3031759 RepID=UPI0023DA45B9|nr:tyrosine-type recombinase/integrase [Hoeflea sp. YIM 152468]MDF1606989.1 tyrosine-type recombinase/integrase [Hoeflea sp. YIM 152468]